MVGVNRIPTADVIEALVDPGSCVLLGATELGLPPFETMDSGYQAELFDAQQKTGSAESVRVCLARVSGVRTVLVLGDFDFLAGSAGRAACQLVIAAFDFAAAQSLPVIASPTSGGTRMQEGTPAFMLMADVAAAAARLRARGSLLLVWLRHPTTGGVMATWGSLGTVTFGQPAALAGFLGPRVFETLMGEAFPAGIQTTDHLADVGVIDAVVDLADLRGVAARLLRTCTDSTPPISVAAELDRDADSPDGAVPSPDVWADVLATQQAERPGAQELIDRNMTDVVFLAGTGEGQRSDAIALVIGRWRGYSAVVVAQDRRAQQDGSLVNPAALLTARRGFALAQQLNLPLVTVIDTPGAELSVEAEEGGLVAQIARCLAELSLLEVPTVSVLLGQGCGGGAIALLPTDRVVATSRSWVSPLPLEGASVIRYRSPDRAPEMAQRQRVSAVAMAEDGFVDAIVPEDSTDSARTLDGVGTEVAVALEDLFAQDSMQRLLTRRTRYGGGLV